MTFSIFSFPYGGVCFLFHMEAFFDHVEKAFFDFFKCSWQPKPAWLAPPALQAPRWAGRSRWMTRAAGPPSRPSALASLAASAPSWPARLAQLPSLVSTTDGGPGVNSLFPYEGLSNPFWLPRSRNLYAPRCLAPQGEVTVYDRLARGGRGRSGSLPGGWQFVRQDGN